MRRLRKVAELFRMLPTKFSRRPREPAEVWAWWYSSFAMSWE